MRENRTYGSEGGESGCSSLPLSGEVVIPAKAGIHNALSAPDSVRHYTRAAIRAAVRADGVQGHCSRNCPVPYGAWIPAFAGITGEVVIPAKAGIHNALQVPGSVQHYSRAAIRADIRQRWYAFPRPADQAGSPFRKLRAKQRCSPRPSARYVRPCVRCWCWRCSVRGWRR